jgi:hypothetical protein
MGETDDDTLTNDSEEHGKVRSECEEDEGTECEDGETLIGRQTESDVLCVLTDMSCTLILLADI